MATIRITNLLLRTIIGINDWERVNKQDVVLNIILTIDSSSAQISDSIADTVDYKILTKKIISLVEDSTFFLLEKLADSVLNCIMEDDKVISATVRIDKPYALRFAESVSFETAKSRAS